MPFNGSVFTLPNGATNAVPGQTVQSAVWDAIHSDIQTGLTEVMSQLISTNTVRNILSDNGDFSIWQRGSGDTSSIAVAASTTAYTADRWYITTGANQACTIAASTPLSNQAKLSAKIQRNNGQTGVDLLTFGYPLTTDEVIRLRGVPIDISLLLNSGLNFSPASGTVTVAFYVGTGSPAKRGGGFTNETQVATVSVNLTPGSGTAVAVTSSVSVPLNATQGEIQLTWTPTGTAGADDSLIIDDVQLEGNNSVAAWTPTNYDRIPGNFQLRACKRFFRKTFPYATAPAQNGGALGALVWNGYTSNATGVQWNLEPIEMFQSPSVISYNPLGASANAINIATNVSLVASINSATATNSAKTIWVQAAITSANGQQVAIHLTADAGI